MITITNSTNYISVTSDNQNEVVTIKKTAITKLVLRKGKISIFILDEEIPAFTFAHSDVTAPATATVEALYAALIAYL